MKNDSFKGSMMLLITAFIWGIAFIAQSVGMESIETFTFTGIRTLMGAGVLLPIILIKDKGFKFNRSTVLAGILMGSVFFIATNLQQAAFKYSTPGKIAFITATYIFVIPILRLFQKKKTSLVTWCCILASAVGLYFLCIDPSEGSSLNIGDLLTLGCAVAFAFHILLIDKFTKIHDGLKLSCTQFAFTGLISLIVLPFFEHPTLSDISSAAVPLLYAGILSCGVAYTFEILGQRYTPPTLASLIMCTESVFAVIAAAVLLGQIPTLREGIGCIIMFVAITISQFFQNRTHETSK